MELYKLAIQNFRGLKDITLEGPGSLAVIAGPNAVGKTSIFEAIRLAKTLLAPSFPEEAQQTIHGLGLVTPGYDVLDFETIAADIAAPVRIRLDLKLSFQELATLEGNIKDLSLGRLISGLASTRISNDALAQYLSTEQGKQSLDASTKAVRKDLDRLKASGLAKLHLEIQPNGVAQGEDPISHDAIRLLSTRMPSYMHGLIGYFPADRALPPGEAAIQVGTNDVAAQRSSHIGNPSSKYTRLKNFVVSQTLLGSEASKQLAEDFGLIFGELLEGKELAGIQITPRGRVSARIRDRRTGSTYDIDQLSSGEKGLLLTFLLMRLTIGPGGIVLLDEPELHLNASVCQKLIPFLQKHICEAKAIQILLCTHSPEVLTAAYSEPTATLFHLRNSTDVSPIHQGDRDEVNEAIRHLGARPIEMLYSRGFLFVEGDDDIDLLDAGFADILRDYKVTKLGGRGEVEKLIKELQVAEKASTLDAPQYFLFDLDGKPTSLTSSARVRLSQWDRYCFENYLLDSDAIYDVLKEQGQRPDSRAALAAQLRALAEGTIRQALVRTACSGVPPSNLKLRVSVTDELTSNTEIIQALEAQYDLVFQEVSQLSPGQWSEKFRVELEKQFADNWEKKKESWLTFANGKKILAAVHRSSSLKVPASSFKRAIMKHASRAQSTHWGQAEKIIRDLVAGGQSFP